jgi:uncharacterized protein (DUF1697 family)
MTVHIALLRAVNLAGHGKVAMSDLRDLFAALGFAGVRTLLQSGNVVFRGGTREGGALERFLETETEKRLGLKTDFLVRTAKEWETIVAKNPFPDEAKKDPSHLVVMFLKDAPDKKSVAALQAAITGPEVVRAEGRQAYITYPAGIGRSRLTNGLIEKKLSTRSTGRNWNTVLKLRELAAL